jgi:Domain of unknown function (DUF4956)
MDSTFTFQDYLTTTSIQIPVFSFVLNFLVATVLSYLLGLFYTKYGRSISNRKSFARNFIFLTLATMIVITIVKSSLALSLGLVGALSIVRFRAAIKEPEELVFLFLSIAIGLGLGADQMVILLVAFPMIMFFMWLRGRFGTSDDNVNLHLTISGDNIKKIELGKVLDILSNHCASSNLKRFDENPDFYEILMNVEFVNLKSFEEFKIEFLSSHENARVTLLDTKGFGQ